MTQEKIRKTVELDAKIDELEKSMKKGRAAISSALEAGNAKQLEATFERISKRIDTLRDKSSKPIASQAGFNSLNDEIDAVDNNIKGLMKTIKGLQGADSKKKITFLAQDEQKRIDTVNKAAKDYKKAINEIYKETGELAKAQDAYNKALEEQKRLEASLTSLKATKKTATARNTKANNKVVSTRHEKNAAATSARVAQVTYDDAVRAMNKAGKTEKDVVSFTNSSTKEQMSITVEQAKTLLDQARQQSEDAAKKYEAAKVAAKESREILSDVQRQLQVVKNAQQKNDINIEATKGILTTAQGQAQSKSAAAFDTLKKSTANTGLDLSNINAEQGLSSISELTLSIDNLVSSLIDKLDHAFMQVNESMSSAQQKTSEMRQETEASEKAFVAENEAAGQIQSLVQRASAFVGLAGAANLFQRAATSAWQSIKELDAQMTEMAVVTDQNIGEYWDQLPEYTARANKLGVAIKQVYEAATLYYQQGLKTEEVVAVSNSTLKMARIANLSAADATDKMTAALRGFNMEVNETNAERIADVYSQLAAITASDVEEISTAMTKTASLASSAGMQFETTAAFLSQIIETTRESAETAGTALKTVIARFQELKKDPSEIGEVDGEIVDANKIESALRSVGVALRDSSGQFRELDEVFLELSKKWDTLDVNTQRYIATIAAGSRQQSRFIAMMSDYERTQELVMAANNSAGASTEQYNKTLDSLTTKLNKLINAWETFAMGLVDNNLIKMGIDLLTNLLTALNNVTAGFNSFSGSALKVGLLITAFKLGGNAVKIFTTGIKSTEGVVGTFAKSISVTRSKVVDFTKAILNAFAKKFDAKALITIQNEAKKVTEALTKQKEAQDAVNAAEKARPTSNKNAEQIAKDLADAQEKLANATKETTAAEQTMYTTLSFSNAEKATYEALTKQGIAADIAAQAAKSGLTAEVIKGMTAEELNRRVQDISNATSLKRIGLLMQTTICTKLQRFASNKLIVALLGEAGAAKIAALATTLFKMSLLEFYGVILGVIVAVAALGAAIYFIYKALKDRSPEARLEAAKEATQQAADAAQNAANAYENLNTTLSDLSDKYTAFEELSTGTEEWRNALDEINDTVLNLINEYPELAKYVQLQNGLLTLDTNSDNVQSIINDYRNRKLKTAAAQQGAKIYQNERQREVNIKNASNAVTATDYDAARTGAMVAAGTISGLIAGPGGAALYAHVSKQITNLAQQEDNKQMSSIAEDMVKGKFNAADEESITTYLKEKYNMTGTELENMTKHIKENSKDLAQFGSSLNMLTEQSKTLYKSMSVEAQGMIDATKYTADSMQAMLVFADEDYMKGKFDEVFEEVNTGAKDSYDQGEYRAYWESIYGPDVKIDAHGNVNAKDEEGKDISIFNKDAFRQFAAVQSTKNASKEMEKLPSIISKLNSAVNDDVFSRLYAKEKGGALTQEDLERLKKLEGSFKGLWATLSDSERLLYGSYEDFAAFLEKSANAATENYKQSTAILDRVGLTGVVLGNNKLDSSASVALAKQLAVVTANYGTDAARALNDQINKLLNDSSLIGKEQGFIGQLTSSDWTNLDELNSMKDTLFKLYPAISEDGLNELVLQIKEVANATKAVDFSKLTEQLMSLLEISENIRTGEQDRNFDEDTMAKLVAAGIPETDFVFSRFTQEWTYIGGSLDELNDTINKLINTEDKNLKSANAKINTRDAIANITKAGVRAKDGTYLTLDTMGSITNKSKQVTFLENFRKKYISQFGAEMFDLLTIPRLTSETNITEELYTQDNFQDILAAIRSIINGTASTEDMKKYNEQRLSTIYQGASPVAVASSANRQRTAKNMPGTADKALLVTASQYGVAAKYIDAYTRALKGKNVEEANSIAKELAQAIVVKQQQQGFSEMLDTLDEVKDSYPRVAEGTESYTEAITAYGEALQLDMTDSANFEWVRDNFELIQNAAQGTAEDVIKLQQALIDADKNGYQVTSDFIVQIRDLADAWESPYNWLWNINQKINAELRERNRLEDEYESKAAGFEITNSQFNSELDANGLAALDRAQVAQSRQLIESQTNEFERAWARVNQVTSAANAQGWQDLYRYDASTGQITTASQEELESALGSEEARANFEQFIEDLSEADEALSDVNDSLRDERKLLKERLQQGREDYISVMTEIRDLLIESRQKIIDNLSNINDSINDQQSRILTEIRDELSQQRAEEGIQESITNIQDKEARLAYLQLDTSGDSNLEILQLQKELEEDRKSLEQNLIDQALTNLEDANERAQEQRERQIEIANASLTAFEDSEASWDEARGVYADALNAIKGNVPINETRLGELLTQKFNNPLTEKLDTEFETITSKLVSSINWTENNDIKAALAAVNLSLTNFGEAVTGVFGNTDTNWLKKTLDSWTYPDYSDTLSKIAKGVDQLVYSNEQLEAQKVASEQALADIVMDTGYAQTDKNIKALVDYGSVDQLRSLASELVWKALADDIDLDQLDIQGFNEISAQTGFKNYSREALVEMLQEVEDVSRNYWSKDQISKYDQWANMEQKQKAQEQEEELSRQEAERQKEITQLQSELTKKEDELKQLTTDIDNYKNSYAYKKGYVVASVSAEMKKKEDRKKALEETEIPNIKERLALLQNYKTYKTGGLADFTGPAWLDGTPSSPELVLNAQDTKNFIVLKDILSSFLNGRSASNTQDAPKGDNYFDVDISVESINDDYDVDQLADRIKALIVDDANYRNVTAIENFR